MINLKYLYEIFLLLHRNMIDQIYFYFDLKSNTIFVIGPYLMQQNVIKDHIKILLIVKKFV